MNAGVPTGRSCTDHGAGCPCDSPVTTRLPWLEDALIRSHQLAPAQRTVLSCLAAGMDIRTTAITLGRSERTVKAHTTAILRRLGIDSRLKAGIAAYHLVLRGTLELPEGTTPKGSSCAADGGEAS